jgi:hypothetical protein
MQDGHSARLADLEDRSVIRADGPTELGCAVKKAVAAFDEWAWIGSVGKVGFNTVLVRVREGKDHAEGAGGCDLEDGAEAPRPPVRVEP